MKRTMWFLAVSALWIGCSGLASAQCAGQQQFGGFDLLQTSGGTQDDLSSVGFGLDTNPPTPVSFSGVPLPHPEVGTSDTVVCRLNSLPNPFQNPAQVSIQIVALYLKGNTTYTPDPQNTPPMPVTVYATINQTFDANGNYAICPDLSHPGCTDPSQVLPEPPPVPNPSNGVMTVSPGNSFDTNFLNIQADLIVVPQGGLVTDPPIAVLQMPADTIMSSGSTWTTSPPNGYPNSTAFPSGGFFVNQPGAMGTVVPMIASRIFRASLYGLGLLLFGIAVMKVRSGVKGGRLTLRPVYLMALAAIAWFLGWRLNKFIFPQTIAHAGVITTCAPQTVSAFIQEGGTTVVHTIVTAVCTTIGTTTSSAVGLN